MVIFQSKGLQLSQKRYLGHLKKKNFKVNVKLKNSLTKKKRENSELHYTPLKSSQKLHWTPKSSVSWSSLPAGNHNTKAHLRHTRISAAVLRSPFTNPEHARPFYPDLSHG